MSRRAKKIVVCILNPFFLDDNNFIDIKYIKIKFPRYIEYTTGDYYEQRRKLHKSEKSIMNI